MFEFLSRLGPEVVKRYKTVLSDIRGKSNSFYDSYLDLQEATIKALLIERSIPFDNSRTCGYLLHGEKTKCVFVDTFGVPIEVYNRLKDRAAKVNHHKHQKSKHILPDSVVAFMETFHQFACACCGADEAYDPEFFQTIYGEYEKENKLLEQEKENLVAELEEMVRENRLSAGQLRSYEEALKKSKSSAEDLEERNLILLQEISKLKSLKLSILDQKLNRTIDMLNDLQEYVVESRAVSLAVGYTIVGQERIGSYIDLAREELGRPAQVAQPSSVSPQSESPQEQRKPSEEQEEPANILDTMTKAPEPISLSEHFGEPCAPYTHSKDISVLPGEQDLKKKKKGLVLRVLSLVFGIIVLTAALLMDGWFKLIAIFPSLSTIVVLLELIWYVKNMKEISNNSSWINRKASVTLDDQNNTVSVEFSLDKGRMTTFVHSTLLTLFFTFSWMFMLFASIPLFIFHFAELESTWATLNSVILAPIGTLFGLAEFIMFNRKPIPYRGRYISFNQPTGSLIYDSNKYGIEAWQLKKNNPAK